MILKETFKHVNYLWEDIRADAFKGDEVALLLYRSNILGADLRITNFGGGNTSCRTTEDDPLTNEKVEIMWIKGSGGDLGTLKKDGLAGLYVDRLLSLKKVYRGLEYEDEMVELFNHCIYDLNSRAPSIDTPLHSMLPYKHIDHLHPDSVIAIAASKDGESIVKEIHGLEFAWIPWQRPGFDLSLKLEKAVNENPNLRGIYLGGHGLFTWGETSQECYINSLEAIEKVSEYIDKNYGKKGPTFGGAIQESLSDKLRQEKATQIAPVLRGLASSYSKMIAHFTDDERILEFVNSKDLERLASMGTSCPDHFLRTKIRPMVLDLKSDIDLTDSQVLKALLQPVFESYRSDYADYYEKHKRPDSPAMRDPNPVVILLKGIGMFTFAKSKQTARIASEFYINAINVMRGAEAISEYVSLPLQEAFDIEYWLLEEAKLQRMPKEKALSRKVALIAGGTGGIGKAVVELFLNEGACVITTDIDEDPPEDVKQLCQSDNAIYVKMDVTNPEEVSEAFSKAALEFGGVDIIVNSAGLAISKPLSETSDADYDLLMDVLVKGQFKISKTGANLLKAQGLGGDIINIVSKNALVAGPNNVVYGTAKASQAHMTRLLAAELGSHKIRVNMVNPDAVIEGSKIWRGKWAEGRAKAYNISVDELPTHYASRTLLNEVIITEDIAKAVFALVGGLLEKSTGNTINVDGGIAAAFTR